MTSVPIEMVVKVKGGNPVAAKIVKCVSSDVLTGFRIVRPDKVVFEQTWDNSNPQFIPSSKIIGILSKPNWTEAILYDSFIFHFVSSSLGISNDAHGNINFIWKVFNGMNYIFSDNTIGYGESERCLKADDAKKILLDAIDNIIKISDPEQIKAYSEYAPYSISDLFEYNKDPYSFCADNTIEPTGVFRKVISEIKLTKLIEKFSDGIIKGKTGIGVLRNNPDSYSAYARPRYFIRQELRKMGMKIPPGRTEEIVMEGIARNPAEMEKIGVIDEKRRRVIEEIMKRELAARPFSASSWTREEFTKNVIKEAFSEKELKEMGLA